jgi:hypothetical protein
MIYKGLFQVTSLTNTKYIWQYRITHDISGYKIYNVLRPLKQLSTGKRFWEFYTHTIKKDACNLRLHNSDILDIDNVKINDMKIYIIATWTAPASSQVHPKSPIGKMIYSLASTLPPPDDENIDETLDKAVIFCQKISNSIQLLQDRIASSESDESEKPMVAPAPRGVTKTYIDTFN